ncbi:DUF202 domain-containing protein [Actinotalea sp.]|uniref:DUF202 domain-containing protein n=1 Tax=Actinotalea sp. TaxID=1872145 RepID=UPI002BDD7EF0|nr:DUF202 domain-containing protein [Actinotalea sp.]HQY32855.1 DUF202 domain-containing protein [Actinotalea sp.]HRA51506.1 DUF202 domain-containing protein [Actinotalea sp.]
MTPPAAAAERTALAWRRTALASTGLGVLVVLLWVRLGIPPVALGLVAALAVLGVVPALVVLVREHWSHRSDPAAEVVAVVCSTVVLAVVGAGASAWAAVR